MDLLTRYMQYVEKEVGGVCPFTDMDRVRMYHIGFMQAVLARLLLEDNRNLHIFQKIIEEVKDGSKK